MRTNDREDWKATDLAHDDGDDEDSYFLLRWQHIALKKIINCARTIILQLVPEIFILP